MKETLLKIAADLRKIAKEQERTKMQKCAKIMLGAGAMGMLVRKIRSR